MTIANLYHVDGFEIQFADNTVGHFDSLDRSSSGTISYVADYLRTGAGAFKAASTQGGHKAAAIKSLAALTSLFAGFSIAHLGGLETRHNVAGIPVFALNSGAGGTPDRRLSLAVSISNHNLLLYADNPTKYGWLSDTVNPVDPVATGTAVLGVGEVHYVEIFSSRTAVVVRVDGVTDINYSRADNGDVYSAAHLGIVRLNLNAGVVYINDGGLGQFHFDDYVLADDWPNEARVNWYVPNADGSHADWASTGANYFGEISELSAYGAAPNTATYLSHAVAGERASVNLPDPALAGAVILGLQPVSHLRNVGGGQQMAQFLQVGAGAPIDLTTFVSPADWAWRLDSLVTNPATGQPFTAAELANLQMGWKVID